MVDDLEGRSRELREYFEPRAEAATAEIQRLRDQLHHLNEHQVWPEPASETVASLGASLAEMSRREGEAVAELETLTMEFNELKARKVVVFPLLCEPCQWRYHCYKTPGLILDSDSH